jgi:uncharacterized membrane protein
VSRSFVANLLFAALGVVVVATIIGLVLLWPRETIERPEGLTRPETHPAEVIAVEAAPCRIPQATGCRRITVFLHGGPEEGETAGFIVGDQGDEDVRLTVGDRVRVYRSGLPDDATIGGVQADRYGLADFERRLPLLLLFVAFAALVAVTGRWRGMRALLGLVASLGVVVTFVVPSILEGNEPLGVALVGAFAVMLITIPLAHGVGIKSVAAMLGTAGSLILVVVLARAATSFAHLTGLSSEEAVFLRAATTGGLSVQGLFLAGMVIGALGVLDDTTVTQSSTVMALRKANPSLGYADLFKAAIQVGHDHIAATVNTLVLAYAGAALPVLLIFSLGDVSFSDAVNNEAVAGEIVAMLVGSIGLIAAVPVTTALAALLATRLDPRELPDEHVHAH